MKGIALKSELNEATMHNCQNTGFLKLNLFASGIFQTADFYFFFFAQLCIVL